VIEFSFTSQFKKDFDKLKTENQKLSKKVMDLIFNIDNAGIDRLGGVGKPEMLKGDLSSCYSRRIDQKHRLIYRYSSDLNVELISCYGHYSDK